jgi:enoyl-CoA hydratase/carnithine racemase
MEGLVGVQRYGAVCVLTLTRPEKLNALSSALEAALDAALGGDEVAAARAVVIAGEGRAFSAGADVTEFRDRDPASIMAYYRETGNVYERVAGLPVPTVAAVHGYCLGGGLELALACDFRVAETSAAFGFPEIGLGILPSSGGLTRVVRMVGAARAKELMLVRERFSASEALAWGLVTDVVEDGEALTRAVALAERLAGLPTLAVSVTKQAAEAARESSREAALLIERLAYGMLAQTPEADEAAAAFVEKRPPRPAP